MEQRWTMREINIWSQDSEKVWTKVSPIIFFSPFLSQDLQTYSPRIYSPFFALNRSLAGCYIIPGWIEVSPRKTRLKVSYWWSEIRWKYSPRFSMSPEKKPSERFEERNQMQHGRVFPSIFPSIRIEKGNGQRRSLTRPLSRLQREPIDNPICLILKLF
mgnify:CR=1 FL=1